MNVFALLFADYFSLFGEMVHGYLRFEHLRFELIKSLRQGVSNVARENYMRFVIMDKMEDV